jgi:predicted ATPase
MTNSKLAITLIAGVIATALCAPAAFAVLIEPGTPIIGAETTTGGTIQPYASKGSNKSKSGMKQKKHKTSHKNQNSKKSDSLI